MGLVEDIISNAVSEGFRDAVGKMIQGNATNETVQSTNTVLTTVLPRENPISDASWIIFMAAAILFSLYCVIIWRYRKGSVEEIKAKYFSLEDKGSRGPGLVLVILGEILYISFNGIVIALVAVLAGNVLIHAIFPTTMSLLALGLLGFGMLGILTFATLFLLISFYVYAVYVVVGLATIKTIGLALLLDPNNRMAWKFLRLFFANQLFPLGLILVIWFVQLVGTFFAFPLIMGPIAPIFVSLVSCVLLWIMHTLAWDWDVNTSMGRYRGKVNWVKSKAILVAAAATGNPTVVAGAAAATAAGSETPGAKETNQRGVKRRSYRHS